IGVRRCLDIPAPGIARDLTRFLLSLGENAVIVRREVPLPFGVACLVPGIAIDAVQRGEVLDAVINHRQDIEALLSGPFETRWRARAGHPDRRMRTLLGLRPHFEAVVLVETASMLEGLARPRF